MTNKNNPEKEKLCSVPLGYYDFLQPYVINPLLTNDQYSIITDSHERIHRQLAVSTTTGLIMQMLAFTRKKIDSPDADAAKACYEEILDLFRLPHEATATYLSLKYFTSDMSQKLMQHQYNSLGDGFYKDAVVLLEGVFGSVFDHISEPEKHVLQIFVITIAQFALNVPCFELVTDLSTLSPLIDFLQQNSPNARYRRIIKEIQINTPFRIWFYEEIKSVTEKCTHNLTTWSKSDQYNYLLQVSVDFAFKLAAVIPSIESLMDRTERDFQFQQLCNRVKVRCVSPSSNSTVNLQMRKEKPEDIVSQIAIHPQRPDLPKDATLSYPHKPIEIQDLRKVIAYTKHSKLLFCHLLLPSKQDGDLSCRLSCYVDHGFSIERGPDIQDIPLFISVPLTVFRDEFAQGDMTNVIFKIDDRLFVKDSSLCQELCCTAGNIFILAHDNSANNMNEWLLAEKGRIGSLLIANFGLKISNDSAMTTKIVLIGNTTDRIRIVSPMTEIEFRKFCSIIDAEDMVEWIGTDSMITINETLKLKQYALESFLGTTYGPFHFLG